MSAPRKIWTYEGHDGCDWSEYDQGGPLYHHDDAVKELLQALEDIKAQDAFHCLRGGKTVVDYGLCGQIASAAIEKFEATP